VLPGERIQVPLLIHNDSDADATVNIAPSLPPGWTEATGGGAYWVPAHQTFPLYIKAKISNNGNKEAQKLVLSAEATGANIAPVEILVYGVPGSLPQ
jgi:hypothetical protein